LIGKTNENKLDNELSYFILFMDNNNQTSFLKILLDFNNFKNAFVIKKNELKDNCARCNSDKNDLNRKKMFKNFNDFDDDFELNDIINENEIDCICMVEYNKSINVLKWKKRKS
jgi:hypothetical protein